MTIYEPIEVRVIETPNGSHIDPPLDPEWSDVDSLRWNAGVMKARTGLTVKVCEIGGLYGLTWRIGRGAMSSGSEPYHEAWKSIGRMSDGAELAQRGQS